MQRHRRGTTVLWRRAGDLRLKRHTGSGSHGAVQPQCLLNTLRVATAERRKGESATERCSGAGLRRRAGAGPYITPAVGVPTLGRADLRGQFPDIFQPHQTMQQFVWQPDLLQVAKFLDAGMKRLQAVDPNEGSNI